MGFHGRGLPDAEALALADKVAAEMVELFDLGDGSVVLDGDASEVVAFAHAVIDGLGLRLCGGGLLLLLVAGRVGRGDAVAGDVEGVELGLVIDKVDQFVGVDVQAEIADFKV